MTVANKLALTTTDLAIGFQAAPIAANINIALQQREIGCLLGRNGSGKSTLFKTLLGILPALAGDINLFDKSLAQYQRKEIAAVVGFVPQSQRHIPSFSVNDIVMMGRAAQLKLLARPSKQDQQQVDACLELVGITHLKQRCFDQLSGGEQQLVVIARSLTQQPQLLIMDEPSSSLDFGNQIHIMDAILGLKEKGIAVLFSSHRPEQALQIADKVFLLQQQTIALQGRPQAVINRDNIRKLYQLTEQQVNNYFHYE